MAVNELDIVIDGQERHGRWLHQQRAILVEANGLPPAIATVRACGTDINVSGVIGPENGYVRLLFDDRDLCNARFPLHLFEAN